MTHTHAFFAVDTINKARPGAVRFHDMTLGVLVVCALCGQVRKAWADGLVEVAIPGKLVIGPNDDEHEHAG